MKRNCKATTTTGKQCKLNKSSGHDYCHIHLRKLQTEPKEFTEDTPLMRSLRNNAEPEDIEDMLRAGADPNIIRTDTHETALSIAVGMHDEEYVEIFVEIQG